jgi:hypothetical protein
MEEQNLMQPMHQDQENLDRPYYKPQQKKKRKYVRFAVFFMLLAFIVFHGVAIGKFAKGVLDTQESFEELQDAVEVLEFSQAQAHLKDAREGMERARSGLSLVRWTYVLPWVGDQLKAVSVILDAGIESAFALDAALEIANDVYDIVLDAQQLLALTEVEDQQMSFDDFPQSVKSDLLRELHQSYPDLLQAQVKLRLAQKSLDKLADLHVIPKLLEAVEPFQELLPDLISGVDVITPLAASVGELAGVDADKQWLMLFLNDMEMRPGGGFMGVYGLLTMRDGEIENMLVSDTYAVDIFVQGDETYNVTPPDPLRKYVGVNTWYFRDANWSPDFPTSSQDAITLLRQEVAHGGQPVPEVHGVIGFTPTFASWLLELTGPIDLKGETYTSENLATLLEFEVEFGFVEDNIAFENRKDIVGDLVDEVVSRLMALPLSEYPSLFDAINLGFQEKRLALYSQDEQTQSVFVDSNWAGDIDLDHFDDVLMVVDANLAALKTDPAVDRSITYTVKEDEQGHVATAQVKYDHNGVFDKFTTRYRTYTRVYAPLGSQLISSSGTMLNDKLSNPSLLPGEVDIVEDLGMTSFGAFISIEPGDEGTLEFTYRLPQSVSDAIRRKSYELQVFKQMGAANHILTVDLDFDKKVKAAIPPELEQDYGDSRYIVNTILDQNKLFTIEF